MTQAVRIYTMTLCPYCWTAKKLLAKKGAEYEEINLDHEPDRWSECERLSGRETVPQIFIGDRHVGGCDDLKDLDRRGELDGLLSDAKP
jgi:glutaredoxin 3